MTIQEFVDELNSSMPTIEQITAKYKQVRPAFSHEDATLLEEQNRFLYTGNASNDKVKDLVENTNISSVGIGALNFLKKLAYDNERRRKVARYNDYYNLAVQADNVVVVFSDENDSVEVLSQSFDDFLVFLVQYFKADQSLIFNTPYDKEERATVLGKLVQKGFSEHWIKELIQIG